ncbi:SRPBCC family protein [Litorisediminicola beolgyonensis]|uniref:SRPBCC family protein n=1 Tax=Litorisediminicola beolgyonensis TaxID=1173614 RepID=A0ABW3ZET9_9RHOB
MEFAIREDIEGTLDQTFAQMSDFESIERQVLRRGIDVRRTDTLGAPAAGASWEAGFTFRGKKRRAEITLTRYEPPSLMVFESRLDGLEVLTQMEFVALSRSRTRVAIDIVLQPRTLSARIMVQSLKLARGTIEKKLHARSTGLARELEARIRRSA